MNFAQSGNLVFERNDAEPEIITITGGLERDGHDIFAQFGDTLIEREADESLEAFRARAREAAVAAGSDSVVFGGLPPMKFDDDLSKGETE